MTRIFSKKNFLKSLPAIAILAVGLLLPLIWWPTEKVVLALLLYCPFLLVLIYAGCYLSAYKRPELSVFLRAAAVLFGLFVAFLLYVILYRALCL